MSFTKWAKMLIKMVHSSSSTKTIFVSIKQSLNSGYHTFNLLINALSLFLLFFGFVVLTAVVVVVVVVVVVLAVVIAAVVVLVAVVYSS